MVGYSDRSRLIQDHRCPRARFLEYEFPTSGPVNGVVTTKLNPDLLIGATFHTGVEHLLLGDDVNFAVKIALYGFWEGAKTKGLIIGDTEDAYYVYNEHAALAEALIRAYAISVLPNLLARFEVVEVEQEDISTFILEDFELKWGSRADALLMERSTLDLYVLSLKTTKEFGKRQEDSAHHDMQGLSEVRAIDQRLEKWAKELEDMRPEDLEGVLGDINTVRVGTIPYWFVRRLRAGASPHVLGVIMQHALKGARRESPRGSGHWYYDSPLIRPYKWAGNPNSRRVETPDFKYAAFYDYQDELGGNHRLGPSWQRENIWETIGVKEWISILSSTMIQGKPPGFVLENSFVLPGEYYRNDEDMERWEKRTLYHERRVTEGREKALATLGTPAFEDVLDEYFEPHSTSCDYPGRCQFQEICYGPKTYLLNPLASGFYQIREANHKVEETIVRPNGRFQTRIEERVK